MVTDLTIEEQHELFKIGDTVSIKIDGGNHTHVWGIMIDNLGLMGIITDIIPYGSYNRYGHNPHDLAIRVKVKSSNNIRGEFYWHYKSLISSRFLKPTYIPKQKIIRTL